MIFGNYCQFCWYQMIEEMIVGCDNDIMVMEEMSLLFRDAYYNI